MLTPERATADRRAEQALRGAELARLRRRRREALRHRAADALRTVAYRIEPPPQAASTVPPHLPPRSATAVTAARFDAGEVDLTSTERELVRSR